MVLRIHPEPAQQPAGPPNTQALRSQASPSPSRPASPPSRLGSDWAPSKGEHGALALVLSTVTIRTNLWGPPGDGWREKGPVVPPSPPGRGRHRPTGGSRLVPGPSGCAHRTAQAPCQGGEGSRRGSWGRGPRPGHGSEGGPHTSPAVMEAGGGGRPSSSLRALSVPCGEDTRSPPSEGVMGADGQAGGAGARPGEHVQRLCSRWRNLRAGWAQGKVCRAHGAGTRRETPSDQ